MTSPQDDPQDFPPPGWGPAPPPAYGPPAYGPPAYGPPAYGPPAYGPPAYGPAPFYGQPAYGLPAGYGDQPAPGEEVLWAVLAHLSVFAFALVGPLVIYLVKKDCPFTRRHAAEALNFHITAAIATFASFILLFVLVGFLLLPLVLIGTAVLGVVAAVAAGGGRPYRYPLSLRIVS